MALQAHGLFSAAEIDFKTIAATGVTMFIPLGPDYGDNGRVGVSKDIIPRAAAGGAAGGGNGE